MAASAVYQLDYYKIPIRLYNVGRIP